MSAAEQLGSYYNLSPATIAALSAKAGAGPAPDPDSPEAWAAAQNQAATAAGLPPLAPGAPMASVAGTYATPSNNPKTEGTAPNLQLYGGPLGDPGADDSKKAPLSNVAPTVPVNEAQSTASAFAPASPAVTLPAHWQPGSHSVSVQQGLPTEALQEGRIEREIGFRKSYQAANDHLEAAKIQADADGVYAAQRAAIAKQANDQMQAIQVRKQKYVADEHAKLESLNAEAQKKIDPDEAFYGTGGKIASAIMIGLGQFASMWKGGSNAALQIVNSSIHDTVDRQKANVANARGALSDRMSMYRDNLDAFGDQERAALATKMQLLDQVGALAEAKRSGAKSLEADAAHSDFLGQIYRERAKYADQFGELTSAKVAEQENEHFVPAQSIGGTGGSVPKREGNLATLSDGTTFVMPNEDAAKKAIDKIQVLDKLQRNNNEILRLREHATRLDPLLNKTEYDASVLQLRDLGEQKVALTSLALGQGVVKEEEYKRAQEISVGVTNGLGTFKGTPWARSEREATDVMLRGQTKRWGEDQRSFVTAAGGSVYERAYAQDQAGRVKPTGRYTGQDATPTEHLAPNGSVSMDGKTKVPTAGPKTSTTIPRAPVIGR